jgi:methionine synthase II (cobalamin-independent)
MKLDFKPACLPLLVGSMPVKDHVHAANLVFKYTPDIPLWVQLPHFVEESMVAQFTPGLPALTHKKGRMFIDTGAAAYDSEFLAFFEEYMAVTERQSSLEMSRFALTTETALGFFELLKRLTSTPSLPKAIKGQVTGPITFSTSLTDQDRRAIFYNDALRDMAVKHLALKAAWQVHQLSQFNLPVIIFIDEPALAGFGSSELISISKEDVRACLDEVIDAIHAEGGLAGIHICANTDWALVLDSNIDIVNFDAYAYFDRFMLYPDAIARFLEDGRILAWGIIPTLKVEDIEVATAVSLTNRLKECILKLEKMGCDRETIYHQSLITPSCGVGPLSPKQANKVLTLVRDVSQNLRAEMGFSRRAL